MNLRQQSGSSYAMKQPMELRDDVVYAWDKCVIVYHIPANPADLATLVKSDTFPKNWKLLHNNEAGVSFDVTGPPKHSEAAQVRALLNLIKMKQ